MRGEGQRETEREIERGRKCGKEGKGGERGEIYGEREPREGGERVRESCQTIRTVRDISRDDRARIATCSLRTPTDRQIKENYSIDDKKQDWM